MGLNLCATACRVYFFLNFFLSFFSFLKNILAVSRSLFCATALHQRQSKRMTVGHPARLCGPSSEAVMWTHFMFRPRDNTKKCRYVHFCNACSAPWGAGEGLKLKFLIASFVGRWRHIFLVVFFFTKKKKKKREFDPSVQNPGRPVVENATCGWTVYKVAIGRGWTPVRLVIRPLSPTTVKFDQKNQAEIYIITVVYGRQRVQHLLRTNASGQFCRRPSQMNPPLMVLWYPILLQSHQPWGERLYSTLIVLELASKSFDVGFITSYLWDGSMENGRERREGTAQGVCALSFFFQMLLGHRPHRDCPQNWTITVIG